MSQYIFLKQSNGEYLKLLADDNGIIQYTVNQADFSDIQAGAASDGITSLTGGVTATGSGGAAAATVHALPLDATAVVAPATPAAGKGAVYVDSTSKNLCVKDDAGVVKHGVQTFTTASRLLTAISDAGVVSGADATTVTAFINPATALLQGAMPNTDKAGQPFVGTLLTGGDQTIQPGTDKCGKYIVPAGSQVGNAVLIVGHTSATPIMSVQITIEDTSAFTYVIKAGDGSTVIGQKVISAGKAQTFLLYYTTGGGQFGPNNFWWSY